MSIPLNRRWQSARLCDVLVDARSGFASGEDTPDGIIQVRMNNVTRDGKLDWQKIRRVPPPRRGLEQLIVRPGDILFNATNSPELVGKSAVFDGHSEPVTFSNHFLRLRPQSEIIDCRWLAYWFARQWADGVFTRMCKQWVNQASIDRDRLMLLKLPLPPLAEQRRIAAILDRADELRRKRRDALELLSKLAQSIFVDMFGNPVTNPHSFPSAPLGDLIDFVGGAQPPKSTFEYADLPHLIRLVQIRDFKSGDNKTYIPRRLARRLFETDDVMIARYGPPVFQILRGLSGAYNVALMKALPKTGILKDFVFYLLQEHGLHNHVVANSERTAGQSGVNLSLLDAYPAYRPPVSLQQEFSRRIHEIDGLITLQTAQLARMDALFRSLQHQAFSGGGIRSPSTLELEAAD